MKSFHLVCYRLLLIEVVNLQADRTRAGDFHRVHDFHDAAVIETARGAVLVVMVIFSPLAENIGDPGREFLGILNRSQIIFRVQPQRRIGIDGDD